MKKKLLLLFLTVITVVATAFGTVGVLAEGESAWAYDSATGKVTATNQTGLFYANDPSGFYVDRNNTATGDYTVTASFVGSDTIANSADATVARYDVGILAYYHDQNNWISFSASWWKGFSESKITDILIAECNNGTTTYYDHFFDNTSYNYDVFSTTYGKQANETIELSVSKKYDVENGYDVYSFYLDGNLFIQKNFGLSASAAFKNDVSKMGYVCNAGDITVTFNPVTVSVPGPDGNAVTYGEVEGAPQGVKAAGTWTYAENAYSVNATTGVYQNHVIVPNAEKKDNYKVDFNVEISNEKENSQVMLSGWYVGANDKIIYILKKTASGYAVEQKGTLSGTELTAVEDKTVTVTNGKITLSVVKIGKTVSLKSGDTVLFEYGSNDLEAGTDYMFGAGNVTAKITATVEKQQYVAYDFYKTLVNGVEYKISAKDQESVVISKSGITMDIEADKQTRVIYSSGTSGVITLTATFGGEASAYGLYVYYINEENNVSIVIDGNSVKLVSIINSVENSTNYEVETSATITAKMTGTKVSAYFGETAIFENVNVEGINIATAFDIGFFGKGGNLTISDITKQGFIAFQDRVENGFILRGDSYATWQIDGETLKADCVNGTTWAATVALKQIDKVPSESGYAIGFAAQVTNKTNTEWKYAVMPFYLDGGNFVFVYISQYAGAGVEIVATSWLNGAQCGEVWRFVGVSADIEELNYVEVRVDGDNVSVYLNRSYAPSFSTNFEGLGSVARAERNSYMGFNVFNTSVNFSEITYVNNLEKRIFADTVAPVIEKIGTMPETAKVGDEVRLATFISDDAAAQIAVTCTLNGEPVAIDKNRFTATVAGEYVVKVVATDVWGNSSTSEYKINVTEAVASNEGGCGSAAFASSLMIPAFAAIVAGVALKRKEN